MEQLIDPYNWDEYRATKDVNGPRSLFSIANVSGVTPDDVKMLKHLLYIGSVDNMNEAHEQDQQDNQLPTQAWSDCVPVYPHL